MPETHYWRSRQEKLMARMPQEEKYRTCCNCWHIKTGTVLLGILEMLAVSILLSGIIRQLMWKNRDLRGCLQKRLRDCFIFNFSHFNLTLAGDYIIALLMISIFICILLLFYGILTTEPKYLRPHLVIQAIGLLASFGYFFLYAWSYLYGDLYTQKKKFVFGYFIERMWLSTILLIFSIFQCYLFITVIKCSMYLNILKTEKNRRLMQFEDVSNRVRLAKENGLWRSTSWGGGFQQYKGQYDKSKQKQKKKLSDERKANGSNGNNFQSRCVQWDLEKNIEKSISYGPSESSREIAEQNDPPRTTKNKETNVKTKSQKIPPASAATKAIIPTFLSSDPMNISTVRIRAISPISKPKGSVSLAKQRYEQKMQDRREPVKNLPARMVQSSQNRSPFHQNLQQNSMVKKVSISSKCFSPTGILFQSSH